MLMAFDYLNCRKQFHREEFPCNWCAANLRFGFSARNLRPSRELDNNQVAIITGILTILTLFLIPILSLFSAFSLQSIDSKLTNSISRVKLINNFMLFNSIFLNNRYSQIISVRKNCKQTEMTESKLSTNETKYFLNCQQNKWKWKNPRDQRSCR